MLPGMQDDNPKAATRRAVAANVRAELARSGKTGADAARELGISRQAMHPRMTGQRAFRAEEIASLAHWLGVPTSRLLADDPKPAMVGVA